jgi:glutamyl-Q tRNA(Asp) synthetase
MTQNKQAAQNTLPNKGLYVGRFAPSPSGPLHFGSLFCALVSFLHAKQAKGKWLVRIEDVDETRTTPEIASVILEQLESHGLLWDGEVIYQTQRKPAYAEALEKLTKHNDVYACECTRQQIRQRGKFYTGYCVERELAFSTSSTSEPMLALRIKNNSSLHHFHDAHLGQVEVEKGFAQEDIVLKRKDGLFSYNLAVVVDDIYQGVTHIVRGADLVDTTLQQAVIYRGLGLSPPNYFHLPVIASELGKKLSKQNHAEPISAQYWKQNLLKAGMLLGFELKNIPNTYEACDLVNWMAEHWQPELLSNEREILLSVPNDV